MRTEWDNEAIEKVATLLCKWQGGRVKLWDYTVTHHKVTLRIELPEVAGNLHIVCGDCTFIRGPFSWKGCDLEIRRGAADDGMLVIDRIADFELHCGVVSAEENVEPIYTPNLGASPDR
jgi:hypothetical protein